MDLKEFFAENKKVAVAFSGGVDSTFLLYAAKVNGADVVAYYVKTQFQPQFEYEDAIRAAKELDVTMKVIDVDVLANDVIRSNPCNRCYFCKRVIFETIIGEAKKDGYQVILDGTNASDDEGDRPGIAALRELKVLSPLKMCNLTKADVRELSRKADLFTYNKPAYACLATRIKFDEVITEDALKKVELAEGYMMKLGFLNHRVRVLDNKAIILVTNADEELLYSNQENIEKYLKDYFDGITFGRR